MAIAPRMLGRDFVRAKLVKELLPVVDDMAGAPSLEDGAKDIVSAIERVCTLIPLPDGPVVVGNVVWSAVVVLLADVIADGCSAVEKSFDDHTTTAHRLAGVILATLFPAGIVVAKKVGRVTVNCEVVKAALEPNTSPADIIEGAMVAVIEEATDAD